MFKSMNYVYAVYKEGGFKNAADKLMVSQPSLSASVKRVEDKVGYPIFDRSIRPLKLTECGEAYIKAVEEIISVEERFEAYVNDLGELKNGSIKIGATSIASSIVLPSIISEYQKHYPSIFIEMAEGTTVDLTRMVIEGQYDMVMDYGITDTELLDYKYIRSDYLILAVPAYRAINNRLRDYQISFDTIKTGEFIEDRFEPVPLNEFKNETFVLLKQKNNTRYLTDKLFEKYNVKPIVSFEASQQMTAYFNMCEGIGCAFVSSTLLSGMNDNPACVYYKLDTSIALRHLGFFWKKGRYVSKAMMEFIDLTAKMCR